MNTDTLPERREAVGLMEPMFIGKTRLVAPHHRVVCFCSAKRDDTLDRALARLVEI